MAPPGNLNFAPQLTSPWPWQSQLSPQLGAPGNLNKSTNGPWQTQLSPKQGPGNLNFAPTLTSPWPWQSTTWPWRFQMGSTTGPWQFQLSPQLALAIPNLIYH